MIFLPPTKANDALAKAKLAEPKPFGAGQEAEMKERFLPLKEKVLKRSREIPVM